MDIEEANRFLGDVFLPVDAMVRDALASGYPDEVGGGRSEEARARRGQPTG